MAKAAMAVLKAALSSRRCTQRIEYFAQRLLYTVWQAAADYFAMVNLSIVCLLVYHMSMENIK